MRASMTWFWCSVTQTNAVKSVGDRSKFVCFGVSARFLHGFCTVSKRAEGAFRCKIRQRVQKLLGKKSRCLVQKQRWIETSTNWDEPAACSLNQWAQGSSPWRCTRYWTSNRKIWRSFLCRKATAHFLHTVCTFARINGVSAQGLHSLLSFASTKYPLAQKCRFPYLYFKFACLSKIMRLLFPLRYPIT